MDQENRHKKNKNDLDGLSGLSFPGMKIPWEKSKAEVWTDLEQRLEEKGQPLVPVSSPFKTRQLIAMAASLLLLLAVGTFMKLYSVKTYCPEGVHTSLSLPDGSEVELNAATHLTYHPYWWFVSREVKLEGEAFFRVEKGKKFTVRSPIASTEVLGTTFNVFARGSTYIVSCHTGSVKLSENLTGKEVTLSPLERAKMEESGGFTVSKMDDAQTSPGWTENMIMFSSTPLRLVFDEIERQFGIVIETPEEMQQVYSGNFSLHQSVDNILSLLCLPFDLEYEHQTGNKYLVHPSSD